jgi:hypothetical protein
MHVVVSAMTPQEFLARHLEMLIARLHAPLTFRFLLQPLAVVIANSEVL